ncbi:MAG: putative hemin transport protein [Bacteroidia bacterium]|jgi:putative hemin transport protein
MTERTASCEELRTWYLELVAKQPRLRPRDAAAALGVSEAELVACGVGSESFRLKDNWLDILTDMKTVGTVMCLTRNESVVNERHGCFESVSSEHGVGLVLGPDIDLRLFLNNWGFAFVVTQKLASGQRESIQFFDNCGDAVLKVYLTDETNRHAWDALIHKHRDRQASGCSHVLDNLSEHMPAKVDRPDSEIDRRSLSEGWLTLKDTHDFFILLARHKVGRQQALRLGGEGLAERMPLDAPKDLLRYAAVEQVPIMVFVGNRGCIQIHSGTVNKIAPFNSWINVLDAEFNLHLNEDAIASVWWVRKPTEDGDVHSLEVFDKDGEMIVQFFGVRKPGIPERDDWRMLLKSLPKMGMAA